MWVPGILQLEFPGHSSGEPLQMMPGNQDWHVGENMKEVWDTLYHLEQAVGLFYI
jgi:hypothetical protein